VLFFGYPIRMVMCFTEISLNENQSRQKKVWGRDKKIR